MQIKILHCSDSMFWYNKHIGETFKVRRIESDRFWVREQDDYGYLNFVLTKDCEVV